jgi:putative multiple sugar transport system substrate-binding protein
MRISKKLAAVGVVVAAALSLGACGSTGNDPTTGSTGAVSDPTTAAAPAGFAANAVIGVSLPWLGTQNWAEANTMFVDQLKAAGFTPQVLQADNKVPNQQQQIETLIEAGAKVIIIGPVDGMQLGTVVEKAAAQGIFIIGYDRLIENTTAVDAVVQFGSIETGKLQGQALLDGLKALKGDGPYNIELFGGGPADPNAPNFFKGAMEVLQPKIDDGTLTVVSGQTKFEEVATADWSNEKAQARMDSLLATNYSDKKIDGALSPNDGIARAIITSCINAGQEIPAISGLDAEDTSVQWIGEGKQWSTVAKPTDELVAKTIELVKILQAGQPLPAGTEVADNGKIDVQVFALAPTVVTKANCATFFANDSARLAMCNG